MDLSSQSSSERPDAGLKRDLCAHLFVTVRSICSTTPQCYAGAASNLLVP